MLKRRNRIDGWSSELGRVFRKIGWIVRREPFRDYGDRVVSFESSVSRGEELAFDARECKLYRCERQSSRRILGTVEVISDNQC